MTPLQSLTTRTPADCAVDDDLVVRERALPALPVLLDDERLTAMLRESGWVAPDELARVDRIRLKSGTRVQAAIRSSPRGRWMLANAFSAASWGKADKDLQVAQRRELPMVVQEDLLLVVLDVRGDRDLPMLRSVRPDDPAGLRHRVVAALDEAGVAGGCRRLTATTIAYNPARRWVGALHAEDPEPSGRRQGGNPLALLKVHADPLTAEHAAHVAGLLATVGVQTPATVLLDDGMVASAWVPGREADPTSRPHAEAVATLLARLSAVRWGSTASTRMPPLDLPGLDHLPRLDHRAILEGARAATDTLNQLDPVAGARACAVLEVLASALTHCIDHASARNDAVLVHGDFSVDQVVIGANGAILLDLDRAAAGPRGWDAASWMAAQVSAGVPLGQVTAVPDTAVPAPLLAAAALLRTPEAWRRRRPGHTATTAALLDLAEVALSVARVPGG